MELVFDYRRIPRSTTRAEWIEIWRWKRVTQHQLKRSLAEQIALLVTHQNMPSTIRADMIDCIVNPPLVIYPDRLTFDTALDLRPGAITYLHRRP